MQFVKLSPDYCGRKMDQLGWVRECANPDMAKQSRMICDGGLSRRGVNQPHAAQETKTPQTFFRINAPFDSSFHLKRLLPSPPSIRRVNTRGT